ncbi:MAG: hypothetical protein HY866_11315 [Chloroflexi bacterium]|nr:hypothetical protein [Chloroflexota bacterium]
MDDKPEDQRGKLNDEVFSYQPTKDRRVLIYWTNKLVITLKGDKAERFLRQIADADDHTAQLIMAKATGNFKRGNERHPPDPG